MMRSGLLKLRGLFSCGVLLAAALLVSEPAFAEKRVALVIGNSAYKNVARLNNPVNDAAAVAGMLTDYCDQRP